jgi:hypothetical protein
MTVPVRSWERSVKYGDSDQDVSVGNSLASSAINRLTEELHPGNTSNVFVFALPK